MKIIATINEVNVIDWDVNTGEYKAKKCTVETPKEFAECNAIMVSFNSKGNGKFVSWVKDGECDLPCFTVPGNVTVGVYAYTEENGKLELRYSPTPVVMPVNLGSYIEGEEPPTPTPGTYADLLKEIAKLQEGTIKTFTEQVNLWELETGIYYLDGGFKYKTDLAVSGGGRHIFLIYKPIPSKNAVRYIHFCGDYVKDIWSSIECGYTDGTTRTEYSILDTSKVVSDIAKDILGTGVPNSLAVKNYVNEAVDDLKYISKEIDTLTPIVEDVTTLASGQQGVGLDNHYDFIIATDKTIRSNKKYQVVLNGTVYNLTSKLFSGTEFPALKYIGNLALLNGDTWNYTDTGESFFLGNINGTSEIFAVTESASVLSLYEVETNEVTTDLLSYIKDLETQIDNVKVEIQGDLDTISTLVGGAE